MYAKLFLQIFDSSIAEDYQVRLVFEDMLVLAEMDGCVDMTPEAIARRTNVPLEIVKRGITELSKPDRRSRSKAHEGRRLMPIDPERDWGWRIVNYQKYREIQNEEARRSTWRKSKAKARATRRKKNALKNGKPQPGELAYEQTGDDRVITGALPVRNDVLGA
jgi:hypothetical protein